MALRILACLFAAGLSGMADAGAVELTKDNFDAEVVNFDLSQYHTVLAGRFDSYADAQATVKKLKAKGIDAYSKKREK